MNKVFTVSFMGVWIVFFLLVKADISFAEVIFASDLPKAQVGDVNKHFRTVFGRNPSAGEWRYWVKRMSDVPTVVQFLDAMKQEAGSGGSKSAPGEGVVVIIQTRNRYVFEGEPAHYRVVLANNNPIQERGTAVVRVDAEDIIEKPLFLQEVPFLDGVELRYGYDLQEGERVIVDFSLRAPSARPEALARVSLLHEGVERSMRHPVFRGIPGDTAGLGFFERQVPFIFIDVYGRSPNAWELAYWRSRLNGSFLGALQGAMEYNRRFGAFSPMLIPHGEVAPSEINSLFRFVYGRNPSLSEWAYWAHRRPEIHDRVAFVNTMRYHLIHNIAH